MDTKLIYFIIGLVIITFAGSTVFFDDGCGDGVCTMEEVGSCESDCRAPVESDMSCGDGVCDLPEAAEGACPKDCQR